MESTQTLPEEFKTFRDALFVLADHAPEVHALNARDVIITPGTGGMRVGLPERQETRQRGSDYKV